MKYGTPIIEYTKLIVIPLLLYAFAVLESKAVIAQDGHNNSQNRSKLMNIHRENM